MAVMATSSLLRRLGATDNEVQSFETSLGRLLDVNFMTSIRLNGESLTALKELIGPADELMIQIAPALSKADKVSKEMEIFLKTIDPVNHCKFNNGGMCACNGYGNGHKSVATDHQPKIECLHKPEPALSAN